MKEKIKVSNTFKFKTKSEAETSRLAVMFGKKIKSGQTISLKGTIGVGKTIFVKGLAKALKCEESPISASFSLMKMYKGEKLDLNHFDLFRLEDDEAPYLGMEEYMGEEESVSVFEWGSPASYLYDRDELIELSFDLSGGDNRTIVVSAKGPKSKNLTGKVYHLWQKKKK
ncbi:MAG: tRNA (adenosine(37)-N6)-threonylcarbamoyltransferase complex ATPase subunit type 1 TsaE [Elusimicrobiota bacterium]|nr:tRNA (adenosine(37)-N6)-threonylcarbamoyltransferase complex ATPase subunit type 1 TsaE [Elusimicrobiota bacterium]